MNIAIIPPGKAYLKNEIFNKNNLIINRDDCLYHIRNLKLRLEESGHSFNTIDLFSPHEIDIVIAYRIDFNLNLLLDALKKKPLLVLYIWSETDMICPIHHESVLNKLPFNLCFTWDDNAIKRNPEYFKKINYVNPPIEPIPNTISFENKKFICTVAGNKSSVSKKELYSKRIEIAKHLIHKPEGFDLFGRGWENSKDEEIQKMHQGAIENKKQVMHKYKYVLCLENAKGYNGYITEKIFDAFFAGAIPVYVGAENIDLYIPKECYIDFKDFNTIEDLYQHLKSIKEEVYQSKLQSIQEFLKSDLYYKYFDYSHYTNQILNHIFKDGYKAITYKKFKLSLFKLFITKPFFFIKRLMKNRGFIYYSIKH